YYHKVNIKEYISSGIIESYVLGIATDSERTEFESMCANYPEIAEARNAFEMALEQQLMKNASTPPIHLKKQIEDKVFGSGAENRVGYEQENIAPVRPVNSWKWVAAAAIILLAGTVFRAVDANNKYKQLLGTNRALEEQLKQSSAALSALKEDEAMLHKPDVKMAAMRGTANPSAYATIYWDTTSKDVYLMVNNLPETSSDKQYQLWALLDGKPIDLGVFARQERLLVKMKNVQNAQAFAITLEPKGGSATPTSQPVVLSKL
ncbi:MAG TPA: anti-sigma factor, partial [Flavisolibacter sp.]|nr:anti-sigma factor [Flavisolibacter sp.]